jgi:hypothetical protein
MIAPNGITAFERGSRQKLGECRVGRRVSLGSLFSDARWDAKAELGGSVSEGGARIDLTCTSAHVDIKSAQVSTRALKIARASA